MNISATTIPPNVSRYNEYVEFDRGLFLLPMSDTAVAGRIATARWITHGDVTAPGVLRYTVELFSQLPTTLADLTTYSLGVTPQEYVCVTRAMCDNPIVIEAFAIRHYVTTQDTPSDTDLIATLALGHDMVSQATNGDVIELTTVLEYTSSPTTPLAMISATINYIVKIHINETQTTLQGVLLPELHKIRPLHLTMKDVRERSKV